MLVLPIKKKWFEMIVNGEKKEEYREIKPYYTTRFNKLFPYNIHTNKNEVWYLGDRTMPQELVFRNGYDYNSPENRGQPSGFANAPNSADGAEDAG